MNLTHIAYCGVDCTVCPEYLSGKCPDCRQSQWPDGDPHYCMYKNQDLVFLACLFKL